MSVHSDIVMMKKLIQNFFVESKKQFLHHGDCRIYRSDRPFCDCGLLYWLEHIDFSLAHIVYPKFVDELYLQDTGKNIKAKMRKKEQEASKKLLEDVFGPITKSSLEAIKMDYDDMYKVIDTVFSPAMFPGAYKRLDKWLQEEVAKDW